MSKHICNLRSPWPIGHPIPVEDPAKLTGPEIGSVVVYVNPFDGDVGTATILERSYVWSPGECSSNGGRRNYTWSVVRVTQSNGREYTVVVDDGDLFAGGEAG